jgi:cytosine/adenosine deaminase-related metal-dependent hydrolase
LAPSRPWTPDECVGLDRALEAYTVHGAHAWHAEHDRGRIETGLPADLVMWSGDLYDHEQSPDGLLEQHVELTLVGGAVAHSAGALADRVGAPLPVESGQCRYRNPACALPLSARPTILTTAG